MTLNQGLRREILAESMNKSRIYVGSQNNMKRGGKNHVVNTRKKGKGRGQSKSVIESTKIDTVDLVQGPSTKRKINPVKNTKSTMIVHRDDLL